MNGIDINIFGPAMELQGHAAHRIKSGVVVIPSPSSIKVLSLSEQLCEGASAMTMIWCALTW